MFDNRLYQNAVNNCLNHQIDEDTTDIPFIKNPSKLCATLLLKFSFRFFPDNA